MRKFYSQLKGDKIKINWNKKPIQMKLFLSFLAVETQRQTDFLGSCTGWTQHAGDNNLIITGGIVGGVEYLDHILYGKNLDNQYNNFVNPFYLFPIMTEDGKKFFLDYYSEEISSLKNIAVEKVKFAESVLVGAKEYAAELESFWRGHEVS